jgi:hypothetical protein
MAEVKSSVGISKGMFVAGIVVAILISSLASTVASMMLSVGPKGDRGDQGIQGPQGIQGEPTNETELLNLKDKVNDLENRLAAIENRFSLRGYWKFDEGTGAIAYDSSMYNNDGYLAGGALWADGKYNKSLSFGGEDEYFYVPNSRNLWLQSFTLELWINLTRRPFEHGHSSSAILNKFHIVGGAGYGYKIQFETPTSENDHLVVAIGDGVANRSLIDYNSISDITLNQWHHIVATFNGSIAMLYIDGALKASSSPQPYEIKYDDTPLCIGVEYYDGNPFFNGLVDNLVIYDRPIAANEVLQHYTSPPP